MYEIVIFEKEKEPINYNLDGFLRKLLEWNPRRSSIKVSKSSYRVDNSFLGKLIWSNILDLPGEVDFDVLKMIHDVLEFIELKIAIPYKARIEHVERIGLSEAAYQFMLYQFDEWNLTEHGSSIGGSWLVEKGIEVNKWLKYAIIINSTKEPVIYLHDGTLFEVINEKENVYDGIQI